MEEAHEESAETSTGESQEENGSTQGKTWYPYITKVQFEKFLSRLENKVPDQIDRDYVRAIIRTPSMIYRFLRGIEAMGLIDRDQQPTALLARVVDRPTRKYALAEVIRNLYKELLPEWEQTDGNMSDDAIIDYFRDRTGMGRDSANKMKMFFKYLIGEADFGEPPETVQATDSAEDTAKDTTEDTAKDTTEDTAKDSTEATAEDTTPAPPPTPRGRSSRDGRSGRSNQDRSERSERSERSSRPERSERSSRPLTETQKAYLDTVQSVVQIKIDGDWDEDMIRVAFDRLERLFDRIRRV